MRRDGRGLREVDVRLKKSTIRRVILGKWIADKRTLQSCLSLSEPRPLVVRVLPDSVAFAKRVTR